MRSTGHGPCMYRCSALHSMGRQALLQAAHALNDPELAGEVADSKFPL